MARVENRRHTRIVQHLPIEILAEGRRVSAHALDISRSGMRLVVPRIADEPVWQSATIPLNGSGFVSLPIREITSRSNAVDGSQHDVAVEFQLDSIEQVQALEHYVRGHFVHKSGVDAPSDLRTLPRIECSIDDVVLDGHDDLLDPRILDISPHGLCLGYLGSLAPRSALDIRFCMPGDDRPLSLHGIVAYSTPESLQGQRAGITLTGLAELQETRIRNFIITASAWSSIRNVYRCIWEKRGHTDHALQGRDQTRSIFQRASDYDLPVFVLSGPMGGACRVTRVGDNTAVLALLDVPQGGLDRVVEGAILSDGGSWYFSADRVGAGEGSTVEIVLPDCLHFSEKRASGRSLLNESRGCLVWPSGIKGSAREGRLIEQDGSGASVEIDGPWAGQAAHTEISFVVPGDESPVRYGEVRHVAPLPGGCYRLGIEIGVRRRKCLLHRLTTEQYATIPGCRGETSVRDCPGYRSRAVSFHTFSGQRVAGLVNATAFRPDIPVVVIPPAFGKKKEALAPLALVVLATFKKHGRDVAVLRYDGTDRPGESENTLENPQRGYEMLGYRISQGREDLEAALTFAESNELFSSEQIVIASFSMSALDTRRLLASPGNIHPVAAWISVMGMPAAKNALTLTLGGLDVVSNHSAGIASGVCGLLGHLLDMDRVAADLIENRYAYLSDARADMARIDVPVFWIHGTHDKWVHPGEVEDVMSIRSDAGRTVVEIPVGHNLRTSDDARRAFRLVAAYALSASGCREPGWVEPAADPIEAAVQLAAAPPKDEVLALITYERERLQAFTEANLDEYWRNYLVGNGARGAGYDFYKNLPPFRAFIDREVALMRAGGTHRILDTGCGTGLLMEALSRELGTNGFRGSVTAVDLVPAALERTREKVQAVARETETQVPVTYRALNLEPNRLLPLARFRADATLSLDYLRGRIEGLTHGHIDQLSVCPNVRPILCDSHPRKVAGLMTGWPIDDQTRDAALDLNRAFQFLSGHLGGVTTDDHSFCRLNFMGATRALDLPFAAGSFDRVVSSLFLSYLHNADYFLDELYRICAPGARIVVSSMRPDSDISAMFTAYVNSSGAVAADSTMAGARQMLSEAAGLFEREEEGFFRFYELDELDDLVSSAGFTVTHRVRSLGRPSQAVIVAADKA